MAIIKCKMCGGDIILAEDKTYGTCEYCGSTMTFPRVSDEQRLNLFNRANHFRRQNEFDKAIAAYDKILDQDDTDAEAHWGAVLSRYGIEYVEDPVTHERIPTCHRVQLGSILTDADYLAALEHAPDTRSRDIYESEAKRIAEIQKGILAISAQEKPYDVFICYKETDDNGSRTKDSTLAQDIYYQLTNEGYKVFFSRITLEDKLGQQYEPYIFAALNSAKVMLVIGTRAEFFNAVWVKNEWNRYLDLMKRDRNKLLIPCYRDMDPYDLPEELSALQSQDMSKIGFMQDIIRGVKKVLNSGKEDKPAAVSPAAPGVASLYKRAVLFLEDGDWDQAREYFDRILDIDPEYAPAYIGKVQTKLQVRKEEALAKCAQPLKNNADYQKAVRFADEQHKAIYDGYNRAIEERLELERKEAVYREADALEKRAAVEADFLAAAKKYDEAGDIRDAKERAANCRAKGATAKKEAERQAEEYRLQLEKEREERRRQEEQARIERERKAEQERKEAERKAEERRIAEERRAEQERIEAARRKKRNRTTAIVIISMLILAGGGYCANRYYIQPRNQYNAAQKLLDEGSYDEAVEAFSAMKGYGDSKEKIKETYYTQAKSQLGAGQIGKARQNLLLAGDYSDASTLIDRIDKYQEAGQALSDGDYLSAQPLYASVGNFLDAADKLEFVNSALYEDAAKKMAAGEISEAYAIYSQISDYADSAEIMARVDANYQSAVTLWESGDKIGAEEALTALTGWSDVADKLDSLREEIADDAVNAEDYDTALAYYGKVVNQTDEVVEKASNAKKTKAYIDANAAIKAGNLETAQAKFKEAGDYADAAEQLSKLNKYLSANANMTSGKYGEARILYKELGAYLNSEAHLETCNAALYDEAASKLADGDVSGAYENYVSLEGYSDSANLAAGIESNHAAAIDLLDDGKYDEAIEAFTKLCNYGDSKTMVKESHYRKAEALSEAGTYAEAAAIYEELGDYQDSTDKAKEAHYNNAKALWTAGSLQDAAEEFKDLGDYSDAAQQLVTISADIADTAMANGDYASALTAYQRLEQTDEVKVKEYELAQLCYDEGHFAEATSAYELLGQYELSLSKLPIARYAWADQLFNEGSYAEAAEQFVLLGDMTDSSERAKQSAYQLAKQQMKNKEYDEAKATFGSVEGYSDADTLAVECDYRKADSLLAAGSYQEAQAIYKTLGDYSDSESKASQCVYEQAKALFEAGDYIGAQTLFASVEYGDSADRASECIYLQAQAAFDAEDYTNAKTLFASIDYSDSEEKANASAYCEANALFEAGYYDKAELLFTELGKYSDSTDKAKESHIQQGNVLMQAGDYKGALTFYETVDYGDSDSFAAQCHFALGQEAITEGRVDDAVREYAKAATFSEARDTLLAIAKDYATINEMEKAIQTLWVIREDLEAQNMLKQICELKAQTNEMGLVLLTHCVLEDDVFTDTQDYLSEDNYKVLSESLVSCDLLPTELHFSDAQKYYFAAQSLVGKQYDLAAEIFSEIGEYSDAATKAQEIQYERAVKLYERGKYGEAQIRFARAGWDYKESAKYLNNIATYYSGRIQVGDSHVVGLNDDGTVVASVDKSYNHKQGDVDKWNSIVAICADETHTIGLRKNGTLVFTGEFDDGYYNSDGSSDKNNRFTVNISKVLGWKNLKSVASCFDAIVGLKADGSVVVEGSKRYGIQNAKDWKDIVAIDAGGSHAVGLKSDGTVVAAGDNGDGECRVSAWKDIIAISAGSSHTVGLKSDGTVVAVGRDDGRCNVEGWENIIAIAAGTYDTVGLKADGTVVTTSKSDSAVSEWTDIIAIAAGTWRTLGLKSDGSVVSAGNGISVKNWHLLKNEPDLESDNTDTELSSRYATLSKGANGENVQKLQDALINAGVLEGKADGDFGNKTEEAVKKAQKAFGMEQTGIANDAFQKRLYGE